MQQFKLLGLEFDLELSSQVTGLVRVLYILQDYPIFDLGPRFQTGGTDNEFVTLTLGIENFRNPSIASPVWVDQKKLKQEEDIGGHRSF